MPPSGHWAIAVHGGAGGISRSTPPHPYNEALSKSLQAAYDVLDCGRASDVWADFQVKPPPLALASALAAVESMESCPLFNAGHGSVLNDRGFCETEASVMDGASMKTGAVCGLRTVKHASRLATLIFSAAEFQFLGFSAAERYADRYPTLIERADPGWFITDRRKISLAKAKERKVAELDHTGGTALHERGERKKCEGETVGATVCDCAGNVAVVTATGGVTNKWEGRIGDTPVIGAGSYASNKSCAVSGTGWGEQFLRFGGASRLCFAVEYGRLSVKDAMHEVVHNVFPADTGGFVGVTTDGEVFMDFNSVGMFRGCRTWQGQDYIRIWEA